METFFGFNNLSNSDDTLFIGIIRNPFDWINSLFRTPHHLPSNFTNNNIDNFLNNEFYSIHDNGSEQIHDRNIYTKERYKNIFESRHTKLKFLIEDMPLLVKNYILIRHEDLLDDFNNTMIKIKEKGLLVKNNIIFPVNSLYYKSDKNIKFIKNSKKNHISKDLIKNKLNMKYENKLNYLL